jgi:hypothetical protein
MSCAVELELSLAHAPPLLGADGGGVERLAGDAGVRACVLLADGACRVRLDGPLSCCVAAEAALWHAAGEAAADARGWYYICPSGRVHGACSTAQLAAWWRAGYWRADLPVRNGGSTAWLPIGTLLGGVAPARVRAAGASAAAAEAAAPDDAMDVDDAAAATAAADELAARRYAGSGADAANADASMADAPPLAPSDAAAVVLVLDTCVLLTRGMPALHRAAAALAGAAVAVVPWTAVCELDGLKRSPSADVAKLARDANAALSHAFAAAHPFFRGESAAEWRAAAAEADASAPGGAGSGDDRILASALRLRRKGSRVLLVTNDTNLRLKALVNGLPACPEHALPDTPAALAAVVDAPPQPAPPPALLRAPSHEQPPDVADAQSAPAPPPAAAAAAPLLELDLGSALLPAAQPHAHTASRAAAPQQQQRQQQQPAAHAGALAAALACVARGAGPVLEALLRAQVEPDWWADVVAEPTPFSGRDALRVLKQHWNAYFRSKLPPRAAAAGAALTEACRGATGGAGDASAAVAAATAALELLRALPADGDAAGAAPALLAARADAAALLRSLDT